ESLSMSGGIQWHIYNIGRFIAYMNNGKFAETDQVQVQLNDGITILVKAKFSLKTTVYIYVENEPIGEAFIKGFLINEVYEINFYDFNISIDPLLLAGI